MPLEEQEHRGFLPYSGVPQRAPLFLPRLGLQCIPPDSPTPSRVSTAKAPVYSPPPSLSEVSPFKTPLSFTSLPLPGPSSCLRETPISRLVELIFLLCLQEPRKPVPRGLPRGPAPSQTHNAYRDCAATSGPSPSAVLGARRSTPLPAGGRRRRRKSVVCRQKQQSVEGLLVPPPRPAPPTPAQTPPPSSLTCAQTLPME